MVLLLTEWDEFQALPREDITVDIHCVTSWTKLDTQWSGVSVDTLLDGVETRLAAGAPATPPRPASGALLEVLDGVRRAIGPRGR